MRTMELEDERERRSITRKIRVREPKLRKVPTNEVQTRCDASKKGALADGIGARQLHAARGTRQHGLVVAEVSQMRRISLSAQQHVRRATQQSTKGAPMLRVVDVDRRRIRHARVAQPRPTCAQEEGEPRAKAKPQQHIRALHTRQQPYTRVRHLVVSKPS